MGWSETRQKTGWEFWGLECLEIRDLVSWTQNLKFPITKIITLTVDLETLKRRCKVVKETQAFA